MLDSLDPILSAYLLTVLYTHHKVDQELFKSDCLSNPDSSSSTQHPTVYKKK